MERLISISVFFSTLVFLYGLYPIAPALGLVDRSAAAVRYQKSIPLIGGVAIFLGYFFPIFWLREKIFSENFVYIALLPIILGLLDDRFSVSVRSRLVVQGLMGSLMAMNGIQIRTLGDLFGWGDIHLGFFAWPITMLGVMGGVNALNMIDGLDGLATTITLIAFSSLCFLAYKSGFPERAADLFYFIPALIAFLWMNLSVFPFSTKKSFLGNSGSLFLGYILVWFLIDFSQGERAMMRPIIALWIFSLPLFDMVCVGFSRIARGVSPCHGDSRHIHHLLLKMGWKPLKVLCFLGGVSSIISATGVFGVLMNISDQCMVIGIVFVFLCYIFYREYLLKKY